MKLLFRYLVAIVMIPVGGVLGVLGAIQNAIRKQRYNARFKKIMAELPPADDGPKEGEDQGESK